MINVNFKCENNNYKIYFNDQKIKLLYTNKSYLYIQKSKSKSKLIVKNNTNNAYVI